MLLLEITLTRVYSVTQGYHFAFLAVSLGLLGFGVSGTVLFAVPRLWRQGRHRLLSASALLFSVTALGSYWAINRIPFDAYRIDRGMTRDEAVANLTSMTDRYPMDVEQEGMAPNVMRLNAANLYDYLTGA